MKKALLIVILSFFQISVFSQQIEFFNVGLQDVPRTNVIISMDKKSEGYFIKNIVVTNIEYSLVKQYVLANNTHKRPIDGEYHKENHTCFGFYDYGCYAVQISEDADSLLYFMDTKEKTEKYFISLVRFLDKKKCYALSKSLQELIIGKVLKESLKLEYLYWIIGGLSCLIIMLTIFIVRIKKVKKLR
jgi:hypothetical protein